ncbi:MAG: type II secretion system protein N [Pseudomonadota bacterium]|nr:type II secretion system protein N [Pseudomonadota bacterium]
MTLAITLAGGAALAAALLLRPAGLSPEPPPGSAAPPEPRPLSLAGPAGTAVTDISALQGLFGTPPAGAPADATPPPDEAPPPTRLNLRLLGILGGPAGHGGSAIVRTEDGLEQSYSVGQRIAEGVTLERVYQDRAIISRRGARESLLLPTATLTDAAPPRTFLDQTTRQRMSATLPHTLDRPPSELGDRRGEARRVRDSRRD